MFLEDLLFGLVVWAFILLPPALIVVLMVGAVKKLRKAEPGARARAIAIVEAIVAAILVAVIIVVPVQRDRNETRNRALNQGTEGATSWCSSASSDGIYTLDALRLGTPRKDAGWGGDPSSPYAVTLRKQGESGAAELSVWIEDEYDGLPCVVDWYPDHVTLGVANRRGANSEGSVFMRVYYDDIDFSR